MDNEKNIFMFFLGVNYVRLNSQFGDSPAIIGGVAAEQDDAGTLLAYIQTMHYVISTSVCMDEEVRKKSSVRVKELTEDAIVEYDFTKAELVPIMHTRETYSELARRILIQGTNVQSTT